MKTTFCSILRAAISTSETTPLFPTKGFKALTRLATAATCCFVLGTSAQAATSLLGLVRNPSPTADVTEEIGYVNTLVGMANNGIPYDPYISAGHLFDMIINPIEFIPTPSPYGAQNEDWNSSLYLAKGSGYSYVMARYGSNLGDVEVVYYSTDGYFSIPQNVTGGQGIEYYAAFRNTENDAAFRPLQELAIGNVPDGGSTMALLGLSLVGFATVRRKMKS